MARDDEEREFTLEVRIKATQQDAELFARSLLPALEGEAGTFPGLVVIDGVTLLDGARWMS